MPIYAIQVLSGKEQKVAKLIGEQCSDVVKDCFVPQREVAKKRGVEWRKTQEVIFTGYVFLETRDAIAAAAALQKIPAYTRFLGAHNDKFISLDDFEVAWLAAFAPVSAQHVITTSKGVIEGDRVIVTEGPLVGREAMITKIDRHKRLAWVSMKMFCRTNNVKVGLEIVRKQ